MNGNLPRLLHASIPLWRQALHPGYSINHSTEWWKYPPLYISSSAKLPLPHPCVHKRTILTQNDPSELNLSSFYTQCKLISLNNPSSYCNILHDITRATTLQRRALHAYTWKCNSSPGGGKGITRGFVSHSTGSEQREIKRTVKRHICECVCWRTSVALYACILSS